MTGGSSRTTKDEWGTGHGEQDGMATFEVAWREKFSSTAKRFPLRTAFLIHKSKPNVGYACVVVWMRGCAPT